MRTSGEQQRGEALRDQQPATGELTRSERCGPLRVLFIEDSEDVLRLMKLEMERLGYAVLAANDAESGLDLARRELPDVVVSDIQLPGLDGYELIRRIRRVPELSCIPAIALTGFCLEKHVEMALSAGFTAHLSKPIEPEALNSLIRRLTSL